MLNSGMEPDIKKFLLKIFNSMAVVAVWFMINATLGIYLGLGIINSSFTITHTLFYAWFLLSLALLILYLYRKWKF